MAKYTEKCKFCRKVDTETEDVVITYHGFSFSITKYVGTCYSCHKKNFLKGLRNCVKDGYFKIVRGRVDVNWDRYIEAEDDERCGEDVALSAIRIMLTYLNVFSTVPNNHYVIRTVDCTSVMGMGTQSFSCQGTRLFFTNANDAIKYVNAWRKIYPGNKEDEHSIFKLELIEVKFE